jgi:hypothetical protein
VRLVAKYLAQARYFECIAKQEENSTLRRGFEKQANVYRKLAQARANQLGISLGTPVSAPALITHTQS